jgi:hypothetical protein
LEDVPEEVEIPPLHPSPPNKAKEESHLGAQRAALRELYLHEMVALLSCFVSPIIGAYLLHAIRSQLSRPSEGLVSNYNLTIFLLASELRPLSHLIKMVQSRTLHLQRVVHQNPYKDGVVTTAQLQELGRRLELLESQSPAEVTTNGTFDSPKPKQEAALVREVRNTIQPELDALNRAVRRYEKKATLLAFQTESRLGAIDTRLDDAIALAAAAAKNSNARWSVVNWLIESLIAVSILPFQVLVAVTLYPFQAIFSMFERNQNTAPEKSSKGRTSRTPGQTRHGGDRVSSRVAKK